MKANGALNINFLIISGSPFMRKAKALGTKSLTNTYSQIRHRLTLHDNLKSARNDIVSIVIKATDLDLTNPFSEFHYHYSYLVNYTSLFYFI